MPLGSNKPCCGGCVALVKKNLRFQTATSPSFL
jgi:hypothetical protein